MDPAHAQRIDVLEATVLPRALLPVGADAVAVSQIVVVFVGRGPFGDVVAQHRLRVR